MTLGRFAMLQGSDAQGAVALDRRILIIGRAVARFLHGLSGLASTPCIAAERRSIIALVSDTRVSCKDIKLGRGSPFPPDAAAPERKLS